MRAWALPVPTSQCPSLSSVTGQLKRCSEGEEQEKQCCQCDCIKKRNWGTLWAPTSISSCQHGVRFKGKAGGGQKSATFSSALFCLSSTMPCLAVHTMWSLFWGDKIPLNWHQENLIPFSEWGSWKNFSFRTPCVNSTLDKGPARRVTRSPEFLCSGIIALQYLLFHQMGLCCQILLCVNVLVPYLS